LITPFGCALRSVGAARALPLRLLRAADVFDPRLDRFFAIASLLLLHRRRNTIGETNSRWWRRGHYRLFCSDAQVR
jgi:hypothetical protein